MVYIRKKFNTKLVPKARLLSVYLNLIHDTYDNKKFTSAELQKLLKDLFAFDATLEAISNYYEPNFYEERLDIEQQTKNLGIRYD
jgi:hypothetical protein